MQYEISEKIEVRMKAACLCSGGVVVINDMKLKGEPTGKDEIPCPDCELGERCTDEVVDVCSECLMFSGRVFKLKEVDY